MGGKGFNQAVALALATGGGGQGKVSFYGTVGDDDAGRGLKEKLQRVWGLNNEFLVLDPVSRLCSLCWTVLNASVGQRNGQGDHPGGRLRREQHW